MHVPFEVLSVHIHVYANICMGYLCVFVREVNSLSSFFGKFVDTRIAFDFVRKLYMHCCHKSLAVYALIEFVVYSNVF